MRDLRWRPRRAVRGLLLGAAACLASGAACAQTVSAPYNVWVQPIDVCNSAGTSCAPINSKGQTVLNGTNTPVGFLDPTSGANITQAIILNQLGVNVVFLPVVQYNSAPNVSPTNAYAPTDFLTLHVVTNNPACGLPGFPATGSQSCDFLVISQQPQIANIPRTPAGQTPYVPTPPLSSDPATINLFFVNTLVPANGGQLYGFSWVGNNGVVISKNTLLGVPALFLPPRPDTLAHEIGHNLNLDHTAFGAGPAPGPSPTAGTCNATYPSCMANLMTAGGTTAGNLRTQPTIACVLMNPPSTTCKPQSLVAGTADQLNLEGQENATTLPISQQREALASGFIKTTVPATLTATK
jgi:hypothetical protein